MLTNSKVGAYAYPVQGAGTVRPHAATQAGPYALTYDAAGNLKSKIGGTVNHSLTWDAENKLTRVLIGAVEYNYAYDAAFLLVGRCGLRPDRDPLVQPRRQDARAGGRQSGHRLSRPRGRDQHERAVDQVPQRRRQARRQRRLSGGTSLRR